MILRLDRLLKTIVLLLLIGLPLLLSAVVYQYHTVRKGDTLYGLSLKYNVSVDRLKKINNLKDDRLSIGQSLKIKEKPTPAPKPKPKPTPTPAPAPVTTAQTPPERPSNASGTVAEQPNAEPTATAQPLSEDYYYTVKQSDGLYRIAKDHNLTLPQLLALNGFKDSTQPIKPGDKLIIKDPGGNRLPRMDAIPNRAATDQVQASSSPADTVEITKVHIVQPKENLYRIALLYGMTVDELKKKNNLESDDISVGQRLYIVGTPKQMPGNQTVISSGAPAVNGKDRTDLIMPITGKVTSPYGIRGGKPHKGVDIAAKTGTPIYAVLDGTVVYAGVQGGYGNVVVLEHPNFVMTLYAHNERILVKVGDVVSKGQQISTCGSTGDSSGPHCHFEYRVKGKPINPNRVLPIN